MWPRAAAAVVACVALVAAPGVGAASTWTVGLAANAAGESPSKAKPAAPAGVTATCASSKAEVTVTWDAVSGATSYTVEESRTSSSSGYSSADSGVTTTSWTSAALKDSDDYWFEVLGYAGTWEGTTSSASTEIKISSTGACS